ncbi:thiosulfate oxidation carrier complex protein SoxZ [Mesorhizobium sp. M0751]|uniref:thiosulfate oxidation carrier complex protein SoxZ n=1 Tax=unclassified Mesorhizobium TaxID=325217 RepID=UPI00333C3D42
MKHRILVGALGAEPPALQLKELWRLIPAHFIHELSISQGDQPILSMEGGISISEDANFRFDFTAHGKGEIRVEATDTDGKVFRGHWPMEAAGL